MDNVKKIEIDEEVLAVISAAIALKSAKPANSLAVKSLIRVPQSSSKWDYAGRIDSIRRNLNL